MKINNRFYSIRNSSSGMERLFEIASLLEVAVRRQMWRERDKILQIPLDSCSKRSVTADYN
jgi:hypothetical protein